MRVRLVLVPIAIAAALVAGCGSTTPSSTPTTTPSPTAADNGLSALAAKEILDKATQALAAEETVHLKGTTTSDGTKAKVDIRIKGKDFSGTVEAEGTPIEIIKVGSDLYLKAPDAFWTSFVPDASAVAQFKGKYVKLDAGNAQMGSLADIGNASQILKPEGTISKGEAKTINGTQTIGVVDDKTKTSVYIATVGKPLPVRMDGADSNSLDFGYGESVEIKAPAAGEVFDLKSLMPS